ncbi:uncharacterized protein EV422DRAFT_506471 [Fimicolochytrium jonesii]|uniref:uncharacterized protein n=1 Tax=Fimicolochytrium jonesii TaxID=1396493 RepID=UPI0022FF351C|nr:uncharacterized protein EV422DRAFT_506471 [Fimicolochytrium jonesii]KAI8820734.1 hypothetical protein EV422DRAFT_506471 [Fimicolochytrium jonesii]
MSTSQKPRRKPVNYEKLSVSTAPSPVPLTEANSSAALGSGYLASAEDVSAKRAVSPLMQTAGPRAPTSMNPGRSDLLWVPSAVPSSNAPVPRPSRKDSLSSTHSALSPAPKVLPAPVTRKSVPAKSTQQNVTPLGPRPQPPNRTDVPKTAMPPVPISMKPSASTLDVNPPRGRSTTVQDVTNVKETNDEGLGTHKRRAQFDSRRKNETALAAEFKELTETVAARHSETQDMHAAVELLMRRIRALEKQIETLGAEPVTRTDESLSQDKLDEITSGVWKKFETMSGKASSTTSQTTALMEEIQAKTNQIRRHLKLPIPDDPTLGAEDKLQPTIGAGGKVSETAPAAEPNYVQCCLSVDGSKTVISAPATVKNDPKESTKVGHPHDRMPEESGASVKQAGLPPLAPSRAASAMPQVEAAPKEDLAAPKVGTTSAPPPSPSRRESSKSVEAKDPVEPATPTTKTIPEPKHADISKPKESSETANIAKPVSISVVTPTSNTSARADEPSEGVSKTLAADGFADDLLAIMNDFGF